MWPWRVDHPKISDTTNVGGWMGERATCQLPEWIRNRQFDSPSRSPEARGRGHPQLDNARYATGATRLKLLVDALAYFFRSVVTT